MSKRTVFVLPIILAAQTFLGGISFSPEAFFPVEAGAVARNTLVGSAGLLLGGAVVEVCKAGIRSLPKTRTPQKKESVVQRGKRIARNTQHVAAAVFTLKNWKNLGADIAALTKPPLRDGTTQGTIFYKKHPALCWSAALATAYSTAAWTRYGIAKHQEHQAALAKTLADKAEQEAAAAKAKADKEAKEHKQRAAENLNKLVGTIKASIALKKKLKLTREKKKTGGRGTADSKPSSTSPTTFKDDLAKTKARLAQLAAKKPGGIPAATTPPAKTPPKTPRGAMPPATTTLYYGKKKLDIGTIKKVTHRSELPSQMTLSHKEMSHKAGYYFVQDTREYWFISCKDASRNKLLSKEPTEQILSTPQITEHNLPASTQKYDWRDGLSAQDLAAIQAAQASFDHGKSSPHGYARAVNPDDDFSGDDDSGEYPNSDEDDF